MNENENRSESQWDMVAALSVVCSTIIVITYFIINAVTSGC